MRILVLGSLGHIGRHLVPALKELVPGAEVFEGDLRPDHRGNFYAVDVRDALDLGRMFDDFEPTVVYNLAGMVSRVTCERAPAQALAANVTGALNVATLCRRHGSRLIHISTSEVYGPVENKMSENGPCEPNNWYGKTKLLGEHAVRYWAEDYCILRPFMFYHEDEAAQDNRSAMIRFVRDICLGHGFQLHTDTSRSWMHMDDAVLFMASLIRHVTLPDTVNVGNPNKQTMLELVRLIGRVAEREPIFDEITLPIRMTPHKTPDLELQELLGFSPQISLEDGVRRVVEEFRRSHSVVS